MLWLQYVEPSNGYTYYVPMSVISSFSAVEDGSTPGTFMTRFTRQGVSQPTTLATGYSTLAEANEAMRQLVEAVGDIHVGS